MNKNFNKKPAPFEPPSMLIELDDITAADLVMDILAAHKEHELSVATLCIAGELCDMSKESIRVAITRLAKEEKIIKVARGLYALNSGATGLIKDVESWRDKERYVRPWGGDWVAVTDSAVPRLNKVPRRVHRRALELRGFRLFYTGLYLRPNNLAGGPIAVRRELLGLGLAPESMVFGISDLPPTDDERARELWDIKALQRQYRRTMDALDRSASRFENLPLAPIARESLLLGRTTMRHILYDPLLPEALMDVTGRSQLIQAMWQYQKRARSLWRRVLEPDMVGVGGRPQ